MSFEIASYGIIFAMYDLSDTICAICTPPGTGGLAAIRISGNDSWAVAQKIFSKNHRFIGSSTHQFIHMRAQHGYIIDCETIIDEVVILPYKAPKSYTTEDVIEIFCHGSGKIASLILEFCVKSGSRKAKNGEFTFRAFVNGRIDLTAAEAVNEIINADNQELIFSATSVLKGSLRDKVSDFKERLLSLITSIESSVEFPMDVISLEKDEVLSSLNKIKINLETLIEQSEDGQILRKGINIAIVGKPNVGKSSILNQLLENERAIVADEPGTTRDTIEEKVLIGELPIVLVDTAGIRDSQCLNDSERLGIERSKSAIQKSDVLLYVYDLCESLTPAFNESIELFGDKAKVVVGNKLDLLGNDVSLYSRDSEIVYISAKHGTNIDKLKQVIVKKLNSMAVKSSTNGSSFYVNERQKLLLVSCLSYIKSSIEMLDKGLQEDLVPDELKNALSKLDEITGAKVNENVIKNIFEKFCIGK